MLMDLLIAFPVIGFTLTGMRDGFVRKLVATLTLVTALIVGHFYMKEIGDFLVQNAKLNPRNSSMMGYFAIVFFLFFVQMIIYRFGTGNYKMEGVVIDKVGGTIMGLVEGILFTSIFLYISLMSGPYSRDMTRDSQFYETVVNIAPEILDFTTNMGPDAMDDLKDMTTPSKKPDPSTMRRGRPGS